MQIQNIQVPNVSQPTGTKPALDGDGFSALLAALMGDMESIQAAEDIEILENIEGDDEQMELLFPVEMPFNLMNFQYQNNETSVEIDLEQQEVLEQVKTEVQTQILNLAEEGEEITNLMPKEEAPKKEIAAKEKIAPKEEIVLKEEIAPKEEPKLSFEQKLQPSLLNEVKISKEEKPESFKTEMFNLQPEAKEIQNTELKVQEKQIEPAVAKENIQRLNDSIIKLVETTTVDNKSVMKVKLHPEELGTLDLTLEMQEGKLVAKIIVENESVKQLFSDKLGELNQNLIKQNINIQDFKVEVKAEASLDFNFQGGFNQDNRQNPKGNRIFGHKEIMPEKTTMEMIGKSGELSILA